MDSQAFQSSASPRSSRLRAQTTLSRNTSSHNPATVDRRGAVPKRSSTNDRHRSISLSQADRLYRLAAEQSSQLGDQASIPPASLGLQLQWITPQSSPLLQGFAAPALESFPEWTVPTPPRSDSGIPNVSTDSKDDPPTTCIGTTSSFDHFEPATSSEEMSSLGFLLPSQYGASHYDSDHHQYASMDQNYIPPMRMSQPPAASGSSAYAPASSSNPALYQHSRPSDVRRYPESTQSYDQTYRQTSMSYDTRPGSNYSVASGQTIPPISGLTQQSPMSSPPMNTMPQFSASNMPPARPQSMYDTSSMYAQPAYTTAPAASHLYGTSSPPGYSGPAFVGSSVNDVLQKPPGVDSSIRVLQQRPKPQCWEHGCNGRQFSTFSNLLRHQREKSGTASKSYCPKCGAEFTRTTARNGHLAHDKCTKQRRSSEDK